MSGGAPFVADAQSRDICAAALAGGECGWVCELGRTRWEAAHDLDGCPRLWFCALRLELKAANKGRFWLAQYFSRVSQDAYRVRERRGAE